MRNNLSQFESPVALMLAVALALAGSGCASKSLLAKAATAEANSAAPMTLPRFLGVDTAIGGVSRSITCARLKLSPMLPMLEPPPPGAVPMALGDPSNLQSPAPAVSAAASIQQSEASAPAKIKALAYLATVDCGRHPQVEEAILAGMDDMTDAVRAAAVQAVIDSSRKCGQRSCGCGGCCTPAIRQKLIQMAMERTDTNCWCEPDARVRRLARVALDSCGCGTAVVSEEVPLELPPQEVLVQVQQ